MNFFFFDLRSAVKSKYKHQKIFFDSELLFITITVSNSGCTGNITRIYRAVELPILLSHDFFDAGFGKN